MSQSQPVTQGANPHVVIVGAGIGGLTLALLLERAGVSYVVLEKTSSIKPLGSALSFNGTITYLLRQLGLFEEFEAASLVAKAIYAHDGDCKPTYTLDFQVGVPMAGSRWYIISRPKIYHLLYDKLPKEKVLLNKRVLLIINGDNGTRVECSDGSLYDSDILVGADGAYSAIRQGMFKSLRKEKRLPSEDAVPMPYNCVCLVGQTRELDPEEFPEVQQTICSFNGMSSTVVPYTWATFNTKQRTVCWMAVEHLNQSSSKEHDVARSTDEWGPAATSAMAKAVREFPIPNGGKSGKTLGDLIDMTDKDLISKVTLEEKVYKTWYSGRTVLLGDACHKLNPAGGAGALSAMHDAVCLANWINTLPSKSVEDIEHIFKKYRQERYPYVLDAFRTSSMLAKASEKNFMGAIARYIQSHMPPWLWVLAIKKMIADRPQVSFLERIQDTGSIPPNPQPSLIQTLTILKKLKATSIPV